MISRLFLKNFRNHADFSAEFSARGALFVGKNGAGKTSILESIFLLSHLKSFRAKSADQFLRRDADFGEIAAENDGDEILFRAARRPRRGTALFWRGQKVSTTAFLAKKNLFATLFSPEDLFLPFAPPDRRRRFLNRILFPLDARLFAAARQFEKILNSRNALLKRIFEKKAGRDELKFFDQKFCSISEKITKNRAHFLAEISEEIAENYQKIARKSEKLKIVFLPSAAENLPEKLNKNFVLDCARGSTGFGAHRDDFCFFLRDEKLTEIASRGEIRSAILALKMAEKNFLAKKTGKTPILLLDDVFSELDADRRRHLTDFFDDSQIFATATDPPKRAFFGKDFPILNL